MSRETNIASLKKAFARPFAEHRLFGIAIAEAGAILLTGTLFYAITLRLMMTMFSVPVDTLMTFFANSALPPEANTLVLTMAIIAGVALFVLITFFEAGLFGIIAKHKESFVFMGKKLFFPFLVILIFFELIDFATLIFYLPVYLAPWWAYVGNILSLLAQLFFFVWQMIASFTAVKYGPIVSLKKSFFLLGKNFGYWGKSVFTTILLGLCLLIVAGILLFIASITHFVAVILAALVIVVAAIYTSLVLRIFFWNRIKQFS